MRALIVVAAIGAALVIAVPAVLVAWEQRSNDGQAAEQARWEVATAFEGMAGCVALETSELAAPADGSDAVAVVRDCAGKGVTNARSDIVGEQVDGEVATVVVRTGASAETGGGADWFAGHASAGGCWSVTIDAGARTITGLEDVPCADADVAFSSETGVVALQGDHSETPATVTPAVAGELSAIHVETGDRIWTGDIVAEIDGRPVVAYAGPAPFESADGWTPESDARAAGAWTRTHAKQWMLAEAGYGNSAVDGLHGPRTVEAIRAFNADQGLASDELDEPFLVWIGDLDRSGERDPDGVVVTAVFASPGESMNGDALFALGRDTSR
ncbi:hypothetical protein GCM10025873_01630 [Demequina sediminis]|uniref:peptidoglycan-binding domain-containing protein n=1 Tax=Demequina sediminis TaxID=1930058 RepID=UPI0025727B6B|nr:peptidoglycan-binding protein [Demequina sediminis]BDZ60372.1 hypothetical protein GCM10025873_01630 [Demequina sediminis]